jgi:hypothetical protein
MRHRFSKSMAGLVAGLATICLLALPAPANTVSAAFVNLAGSSPGNLTIYNEDGDPLTSIPLPGTLTCSMSPTSFGVTATSSTTYSGTFTMYFTYRCQPFVFGTNQFCSYTYGTLAGTYSKGGGTTHTYTSSTDFFGSFTIVLRKNLGTPHNCQTTTTTSCHLKLSGLSVSGTITSAGLPTLAYSDTATVAGSTPGWGSLEVIGTLTECGLFVAANLGSVSINAKVHV